METRDKQIGRLQSALNQSQQLQALMEAVTKRNISN